MSDSSSLCEDSDSSREDTSEEFSGSNMAAVKAMYVRFSKGNFRKTDALSALKCGFFTFTFDVICPKNDSFWGSVAL